MTRTSLRRSEAAEIDRQATGRFGIPSLLLMECAGLAVARVAIMEATAQQAVSFVVFAGPGNNGADGLAAARHLSNRTGGRVDAVLCGSAEQLANPGPEARLQRDMASRLDIGLRIVAGESDVAAASRLIESKPVIVIDAVYGIGLRRPLQGLDSSIVRAINAASASAVVAVDTPSGLDCDTGVPLGDAVRASVTVTFGLPKAGLLAPGAREFVGRLAVAEIGFPRELLGIPPGAAQPELAWIAAGCAE